MESGNNDSNRKHYIEEILRQISTQSAIIGGFAFAGLSLDFNSNLTGLQTALTIVLSIVMGLNILALFISGILLFVSKIVDLMNPRWNTPFSLCWFAYLIGLFLFLSSLPIVVWSKNSLLGIFITIFTICIMIVMAFQFYKIAMKTEQEKSDLHSSHKCNF